MGTEQGTSLDTEDLDLVDDRLEDEGKDAAALWTEFDQAEAATGDSQNQDAGSVDDPDAADGQDQDDDHGAADPTAGSDDAPLEGKGQSDGDTPTDSAQQGDDIWATASPEHRAAFEAAQKDWEVRDRRLRGQVSALTRQLNELQRQRQQPAAPQAGAAGQGQQQDGNEDADGFLASDEWKSFQEEYPEVAAPLAKVIGGLQQNTTRLEKELSAIGFERRQAALSEQATLLAEQHPDWQKVAADKGFVDWLQGQPRHIQEAAYRNANEIVDAAEAADVVGRYKQFRVQQGGGALTDTTPQGQSQGTGNNRLAGKRQRQLESATAARSRGPGAASGIPEDGDPEALWKMWDEMERRQAARG